MAISGKVAATLHAIVEKARKVDELVAEIAIASREQSQGIEQLNAAVGQMDKVTQANAANAEESASTAEELNAQASGLKRAVRELLRIIGQTGDLMGQDPKTSAHPTAQPRSTPGSLTPQLLTGSAGNKPVRLVVGSKPARVPAKRPPEVPMDGDFKDF